MKSRGEGLHSPFSMDFWMIQALLHIHEHFAHNVYGDYVKSLGEGPGDLITIHRIIQTLLHIHDPFTHNASMEPMRFTAQTHTPSFLESLSLITKRIYHSFTFTLLAFFMLFLNFFLLLWLGWSRGKPEPLEWFLGLELCVTLALMGEITYKALGKGWREWSRDVFNWFDLAVLLVCALSLAAYALWGVESQESIAVAVTSARYLAQTLRLGALFRHARAKNPHGIVEFEEVRFEADGGRGNEASPKEASWMQGRGRVSSTSPVTLTAFVKKALRGEKGNDLGERNAEEQSGLLDWDAIDLRREITAEAGLMKLPPASRLESDAARLML